MKSRVPFFFSCRLFTGSSQASSLSEAHPVIPGEDPWCVHGWWGAWYKDLAEQWAANGLAVDGELPSAALFRVCCKSMGKIYVVSSKEMRAWVARGGKMYPNPTGTLVCSLVLWREVKGRIFLLFPEEILPALGRDPAQTGHSPEDAIPAMFNSRLLGLRIFLCWCTIFKIKAASVPRVERGLLDREEVRLCFMTTGLFPWCYGQVFRLCSSKQELICPKHWAWAHWPSSSDQTLWPFDLLMQCLLYVAEHFPPLLGNTYWYFEGQIPFVIFGRDQIFIWLNFMLPKRRK